MLNVRETVELISQAEELNKDLQDKVLRHELSVLKKEMYRLNQTSGVMKDVQELSCEYYTNELKHTVLHLSN